MKNFPKKSIAKKSIAPLYPAQLEKRRYIVFEVLPEENTTEKNTAYKIALSEAVGVITDAFFYYCGQLHAAKAQLQYLPQFSTATKGIFRINNGYDQYLRASFCIVDEIQKTKVIIRSVFSTGILDKAKRTLQK